MADELPGLIKKKKGLFREYGEALLTALLVAFVVRSFVFEAFRIPSGSMIPTLMVGDHIFVNKFIYGLRIPFTKIHFVNFRTPQRGEAIVFIYPIDESKDFIKRVVGLPGDTILIKGDDVSVNGALLQRTPTAAIASFPNWENFNYYVEKLGAGSHLTQYDHEPPMSDEALTIHVPEGHLFMMGDNRDNSSDSRDWGFVPLENVKGKAMFVWLSIDFDRYTLRWDRFGKWIR